MEYSINQLAKAAGISTRTLRYYHETGLLLPHRINSSGYRIYTSEQAERLQHIMFYRELGVELSKISDLLNNPHFDAAAVLEKHITELSAQRKRLDTLIQNAKNTLESIKGERTMNDKERFEGFKKQIIDENETKYGSEIRSKYGNESVNASNAKIMNMTKEEYAVFEKLGNDLNLALAQAVKTGDPACEIAQKAAEMHKQWLCCTWQTYSKEAHVSLAQMYVSDSRFTEYYEKIAPGCAQFLCDELLFTQNKWHYFIWGTVMYLSTF